jgi:hypothetical protein
MNRATRFIPQILGWREGAAGHSGSVTWATVLRSQSFTDLRSKNGQARQIKISVAQF